MSRQDCERADRDDPLAGFRSRFSLPEGVIYLDGNSLGALPVATAERIAKTVSDEWGQALIRAWNSHDWVNQPGRVGDKLARLLGAAAGEIIVADSTSLNLFKLLSALLTRPLNADRNVILSERGNFPTDLYIAQGLNHLLGGRFELKLVEGDPSDALDRSIAVAIITQVDYRSGRLLDMAALNARAREVGASIIWDLSHSGGAVPVQLGEDGAEYAVGCGYKYLNGGPGAPAFLYVRSDRQASTRQPLTGWFGHAAPFDFATDYRPAAGIDQMLVGTPSVLASTALECGVDLMLQADMSVLRAKSVALTERFIQLVGSRCAGHGFELASPREYSQRGSQVSFRHEHAWPIMQALIERGVIGDFRKPDYVRFGFAPLYVRHVDVWDAVESLKNIMDSGAWREARFQKLNAVT
ncbi:MAG: kynureninase [Betaproteobacteria bacterium]|nr:kynureninase [Betaproteobacteria bacterium]